MDKNTGHKKLTPKQAVFVREYLIDLNASAAAKRAGYSKNRHMEIGWQLLQKTIVQAAIQAEQDARAKRTKVTQDYVLAEIKAVFEDAKQQRDGEMIDRTNALQALEKLAKHTGLYEKDNSQRQPQIVIRPPAVEKPEGSGK